MSAQHTPGPWLTSEPNGRGNGWRAGPAWLGYDGKLVANDAMRLAQTLRAAITKATGEAA